MFDYNKFINYARNLIVMTKDTGIISINYILRNVMNNYDLIIIVLQLKIN